jgi:hypothetical protein
MIGGYSPTGSNKGIPVRSYMALIFCALAPDAFGETIQVERCQNPLAVTLYDRRGETTAERDFLGCGKGQTDLSLPEGMPDSYRVQQYELARFATVTAVAGDKVQIAIDVGDGKEHRIELEYGQRQTLPTMPVDVVVRPLPGGPWVTIQANASVPAIARAVAKTLDIGATGVEQLADTPIALNFQRIRPTELWNLIADVGQAWAVESEKHVRFGRPDSAADADPRLRMSIPSGEPPPRIVEIVALRGEAEHICASEDVERCIDLHTQIQRLAEPPNHAYPRVHLESRLIQLQAASGNRPLVDRLVADLKRQLASADYRRPLDTDSLLDALTLLLELGANDAAAVLVEPIAEDLAGRPAQQIRLSSLRFDALQLALAPDRRKALDELNELATRFFEFDAEAEFTIEEPDYELKRLDASPVSFDALDRIQPALRLAARRVADDLREQQRYSERAVALATGLRLYGSDSGREILLMQMVHTMIRLDNPAVALSAVQNIDCASDSPTCEYRRQYEPALLLVVGELASAQALVAESREQNRAPCARPDAEFLDALAGDEVRAAVRSSEGCASGDTLAALVLDALPDQRNPWQHYLAAEAYAKRAAANANAIPAALEAIDAALATSEPAMRPRLEKRKAGLEALRADSVGAERRQ